MAPPLIHAASGAELRVAGPRPAEVREIRTGILLPAVSPISQRKPDYIKSLNPGLRPRPAVQVLSKRGRGGGAQNEAPRLTRQDSGSVSSIQILVLVEQRRCFVFFPLIFNKYCLHRYKLSVSPVIKADWDTAAVQIWVSKNLRDERGQR